MDSIPSRFQGIVIPKDDPFKNDKLGYSKYSSVLKGMVDMYKDSGCVIAISGKWGTGKTTFVQMWKASLPAKEYSTVYFNAWETDYFSDPLTAILGELKEISQDSESFKTVCASLGKVALAAGGSALKGFIKKATGIDSDIVKDSVESVKSLFQENLEDYTQQKQSLVEFKQKLSEYVAGQDGKPVVFIVDELDRCNPHYAVKVLEVVKHLFDVPNICFVLAIDKKQLECSIKGFYGSSEIDAENYLRRFVDVEFIMPEPNIEGFTNLLYQNYGFHEFFEGLNNTGNNPEEDFRRLATSLCRHFQLDLRTYDKVLAHTRLAYAQIGNETILVEIVLLLSFLRITDPGFFNDISSHRFGVQELLYEFERKLPNDLLVESDSDYTMRGTARLMVFTIVSLLMLYDCLDGRSIEGVFNDVRKDANLALKCSIINKETLQEAAGWFGRRANPYYGLKNVLKIVNLLKQFQ